MQKIVVVSYTMTCEESGSHFTRSGSRGAQEYEYLAPESAKGTEKFAVVCPKGAVNNAGNLKVVRVLRFKDMKEKVFDGDLKPVVDLVDTDAFEEQQARYVRKKQVMAQIEQKISERSKISQLEALAGDDPEALALLKELKNL